MTRLKALSPGETSGKTKELYAGIEGQLGMVPNMMRTMGNSPAFLEGYLNFSSALSRGVIGARTGVLIALAVAESNGCDYCLSAHSYIGANLVKIDAVELNDARIAKSADLKTEAVLRFAKILVRKKGMLSEEDIINIRKAGFTDEGIVEIVGHVALNILTNYVNLTAKTDIDFPVVETFSAAVI